MVSESVTTASYAEAMERTPTPIDTLAEHYVDELVTLVPEQGTYLGRTEHDGRWSDYSPAGLEALDALNARTARALAALHPVDHVDEITKADLGAELDLAHRSFEAELGLYNLNVIESPSQQLREVFDLMPKEGEIAWQHIASRLRTLPDALAGVQETLSAGAVRGLRAAARQVAEVAAQADRAAAAEGSFGKLIAEAPEDLPASLRHELERGATSSRAAFSAFAEYLRTEQLPQAPEADGVGRERYELASEQFLGLRVDLDESYEWGLEELARMIAEQERTASEIVPGGSLVDAVAALNADPNYLLHSTADLQAWMQRTSDQAVAELNGVQFDIPEPLRTLECRIAPSEEGAIYYTGPSDDMSRPGRMWWSVPQGVTTFHTWREKTTVYHEGVPGHHLQVGQAAVNRAQLNTWRRQFAGTSGHWEGWALYAERLMEEFGYLDAPADRLGMLDAQRMRAARVVLDIGVHLGKQRPDGHGQWTGDYAFEFFTQHANEGPEFARFEVLRYLGWPGQAPSYKIGQRIWQQLRADRAARDGAKFDLKAFHAEALNLGSVRLDTLQAALASPPHRA